jgi:predicted RNA binding protein YcfA (HicA-like mRNA interferase family)
MPKLPQLSGKDLVKILCKLGFVHLRTRGSHAILTKQDKEKGKITLPVPLHPELAKGTLKSIMNQSGINLEELLKLK